MTIQEIVGKYENITTRLKYLKALKVKVHHALYPEPGFDQFGRCTLDSKDLADLEYLITREMETVEKKLDTIVNADYKLKEEEKIGEDDFIRRLITKGIEDGIIIGPED